jgi:hypothetical protein
MHEQVLVKFILERVHIITQLLQFIWIVDGCTLLGTVFQRRAGRRRRRRRRSTIKL